MGVFKTSRQTAAEAVVIRFGVFASDRQLLMAVNDLALWPGDSFAYELLLLTVDCSQSNYNIC